MRKKRSLKNEDLPEWLKSSPPQSESKTDSGEKTKDTRIEYSSNKEDDRAQGMVLLGVSEDDVEASPKIEHLFKGIGGKSKVFEYLEGSDEREAREMLKLRKRLSTDQATHVPFEAYCIALSIPVKKMFGLVASEVADQEAKAKQLMFNARHSKVVEASLAAAMDVEFGSTDRRMLHQAAGFVPVPKNNVTHVHGSQLIDNRIQTSNIAVLPSVEDTVKRLGDRFNDRVLTIAPAEPAMIEPGDDEDGDD